MNELDLKIQHFKELSEKTKAPKKRNKLNILVTTFLVTLLLVQAANVYINYAS